LSNTVLKLLALQECRLAIFVHSESFCNKTCARKTPQLFQNDDYQLTDNDVIRNVVLETIIR